MGDRLEMEMVLPPIDSDSGTGLAISKTLGEIGMRPDAFLKDGQGFRLAGPGPQG